MNDRVNLIRDEDLPNTDWKSLDLKLVKNLSFKNYVGREEAMTESILTDAKDWGFDAVYIDDQQLPGSQEMHYIINFYKVRE